jgi:hypothetical protein
VLFSTKKKIYTLLGIVLRKVSSQGIKHQSCENKASQIHDITGKEKIPKRRKIGSHCFTICKNKHAMISRAVCFMHMD